MFRLEARSSGKCEDHGSQQESGNQHSAIHEDAPSYSLDTRGDKPPGRAGPRTRCHYGSMKEARDGRRRRSDNQLTKKRQGTMGCALPLNPGS